MVGSVSSPPTRLCHLVASRELRRKNNKTMKKKGITELMSQRSSFSRLFDPAFNGTAVPSVWLLSASDKKINKTVANANDVAGPGISVTSPRLFFFNPVAINMPRYCES